VAELKGSITEPYLIVFFMLLSLEIVSLVVMDPR